MKRTDRNRDLLIAAFVIASFAIAPNLTLAADCPVPVENHIPAAPPPPLNIGAVKDLLLEYHQKYYDIDVAAVFSQGAPLAVSAAAIFS